MRCREDDRPAPVAIGELRDEFDLLAHFAREMDMMLGRRNPGRTGRSRKHYSRGQIHRTSIPYQYRSLVLRSPRSGRLEGQPQASEIAPISILRDGAARLLRMRSVSSPIDGFMETLVQSSTSLLRAECPGVLVIWVVCGVISGAARESLRYARRSETGAHGRSR